MAATKGYKLTLTMPSYISLERRVTMRAFRANLVLTDPTKGMGETVKKVYYLLETYPEAVMLQQFNNPANVKMLALLHLLLIYEKSSTEWDFMTRFMVPVFHLLLHAFYSLLPLPNQRMLGCRK
ncbi:bifunctional L-3-cyanoalanine synthase/cysteine synthase 2, mitochondrial [Iris pallida]|uniref:Bifunctional L-3-cyanoalanine synthase/cysteine synthase 2, mitochondrial n=1 Tax=Iris pallida TaxID=29817 RepID=A0AAX6ILG1_IRIPA|nr:bifunctional L-3-cyanoalanine synthase/cysteine synthase 2, mitochondrial [Iris pallida]KAJ6853255.1 bifunctional L-3-cyanoalanine synthase/cysteine synthase 2, mitochondrial [Iris pallida]